MCGLQMDPDFKEKRKAPRFNVTAETFAVISSYHQLGKIIDICSGGLAFQNYSTREDAYSASELDIFTTDGFNLKEIPFKIIATIPIVENFQYSMVQAQRYCLQFEELQNDQKLKLEYFIRTYGENLNHGV